MRLTVASLLITLSCYHSPAAGFVLLRPTAAVRPMMQPNTKRGKYIDTTTRDSTNTLGLRMKMYASSSEEDDGSFAPSDEETSSSTELLANGTLDVDAIIKYISAVLIQMGMFYTIFSLLDKLVSISGLQVPLGVNFVLFYATALKSRVLNPLANNRPKPKTLEVDGAAPQKRKMPSWTPPGVVFPIVWLLIIGPIRALTSAMVYQKVQCYANPAILSLMLHLSIGDVWNTINNVEKRYGVAVVGILFVWLSKAFAAWQYWAVVPIAGKLLSASLVWLTVASALVTSTWRLNPDPHTGKPEPLYPVKGKTSTKYMWFASSGSNYR